jgi:molecular chaperone DnaK (HSP70)
VFGGELAQNRQGQCLERTTDESKRMLGREFSDSVFAQGDAIGHFVLKRIQKAVLFQNGTEVRRKPFDISGLILEELKSRADSLLPLGQQSTSAVMTVPANFNQRQKDETHWAPEAAAFTEAHLRSEPTVTAIAFGYYTQGRDSNRKVLFSTLRREVLKFRFCQSEMELHSESLVSMVTINLAVVISIAISLNVASKS